MSSFLDQARFARDHRWAPDHMSDYLDDELRERLLVAGAGPPNQLVLGARPADHGRVIPPARQATQPAQLYVRSRFSCTWVPVNGRSVPLRRSASY